MSAVSIPLLARASSYGDRTALLDHTESCSYRELLARSTVGAHALLRGDAKLRGARVAFLTPADISYAVTTWAIWQAGAIAVPLCIHHPAPELRHILRDAGAQLVLAHADFTARLAPVCAELGVPLRTIDELRSENSGPRPTLPTVTPDDGALILYTSGTTGKPKGVLTGHGTLAAQLSSVTEAWAYGPQDRNLLVLPLHHLHGILNVLWATLWAGGRTEMQPAFDADTVWKRIAAQDGPTLFMAVPTIYAKLIAAYQAASPQQQGLFRAGCQRLRLMVSGSAALPVPTLQAVREISGHTLLERYGMTEIGMALGNPLHGERRPGHVGHPFPGVEVRLVDEHERPLPPEQTGQLQVRGPNVFQTYWGRPEDTAAAFTADGYFRTGDVAVCEDGSYRILGRASVDILKTGGYKVSALEIEACLRAHPAVADCAVVGIPDSEWGQRVAAAVVLRPGHSIDLSEVRRFGKEYLATYKVPSRLIVVPELPRNAMGKVQKPAVTALWATTD